jgi:uracil-DNA glycosylase
MNVQVDWKHILTEYTEQLRQAGVEHLPNFVRDIAIARKVSAPILVKNILETLPSRVNQSAPIAPVNITASAPARKSPALPTARQAEPAEMLPLNVLSMAVANCYMCPALCSTRLQPVFGNGPVAPKVLFLSGPPTKHEEEKGRYFVGALGDFFDTILGHCGLKREQVYITGVLKCRVPAFRQPLDAEITQCRTYLTEQIRLIRPQVIFCLGATAARSLFGETVIDETRLAELPQSYSGIPAFTIPHPNTYDKSPENKREAWNVLKQLKTMWDN